MIYRLLGGLLTLAVLLAGVYVKGCTDGARRESRAHQADRATWQTEYDNQVRKTADMERARDAALKEITDALKPALAAAESSVDGLARRLRLAQAQAGPRDCSVPDHPGAAPGDSGTSRVPGVDLEAERLSQLAWNAAARDSARLTACQRAYERVRTARASGPPEPLVEPDLSDPADAERRREAAFDVLRASIRR